MFLVDTSVWVDHLSTSDDAVAQSLNAGEVVCHPFIVGELALGSIRNREGILSNLGDLPALPVASAIEVLALIEDRKIFSKGIGYVDCHLIASALLTPGTRLWTRDKRLLRVAMDLRLPVRPIN